MIIKDMLEQAGIITGWRVRGKNITERQYQEQRAFASW
jgi:hypothetical protein